VVIAVWSSLGALGYECENADSSWIVGNTIEYQNNEASSSIAVQRQHLIEVRRILSYHWEMVDD
jgi:hypothetical protein